MTILRLSRLFVARAVAAVSFCGVVAGSAYLGGTSTPRFGVVPEPSSTPPRGRAAVRTTRPRPAPAPKKYSDFPHSAKAHQIACSSCHKFPSPNWNKVRPESDAFQDITDYPKHESCVGCHKQQFFRGRPPVICSICHTNPGPRDSSRHPFPNPRELFDKSPKGQKAPESDFGVSFPHDKHIDIVTGSVGNAGIFQYASYSRSPRAEESCSVCHKTYQPAGDSSEEYVTKPPAKLGDAFWLKKGTFKTTPIGHTVCFTCHTADSGFEPTPANCGTCHKLRPAAPPADFDPKIAASMGITDKIMLTQWRRRDSSGAFRHEFSVHADLECATCHNVKEINTLDAATKKVHITSCAMCHVSATLADGGALNFEADQRKKDPSFQCIKCHVVFGKQKIPESHLKALAEAAGN